MSLITFKIIAGIVIFMTSLISAIYPCKTRLQPTHHTWLELGDALASGIFLGTGLFHMLPDAIHGFSTTLGDINFPIAEFFCAIGFLLLLGVERISACLTKHTNALACIIAAIIIIHSFIEGTALGVNTASATAAIIFLAIIAHKGSESFALAITLNQSALPIRQIILLIAIYSLMTPLGIATGTYLTAFSNPHLSGLITAGFNAFAAGTFLYISTLHHINHHKRAHESEGLLEFIALVVGLSIMALLALYA